MDGELILVGALSGALVVLSGALYALLFALGRMNESRLLMRAAYLAYVVLVVCVLLLSRALRLEGFWVFVIVVMLIGYLLAPAAIWHLCIGTHGESGSPSHSPTKG